MIIGKLFRDVNVTPGEVKYLGDLEVVTHNTDAVLPLAILNFARERSAG
jgi:hypothetical protein